MNRLWAGTYAGGIAMALMLPGPIDPGRALALIAIAIIFAAMLISDGTKAREKSSASMPDAGCKTD